MWIDPIVKEVRDAGAELARKANYDLHTLFKNLRKNEKRRRAKIVSRCDFPREPKQERVAETK